MVYVPSINTPIATLDELRAYVQEELKKIGDESAETTSLELRPIYAEPTRPREGMIVSADGVSWNPGAGAGAYEYKGAAWVKL